MFANVTSNPFDVLTLLMEDEKQTNKQKYWFFFHFQKKKKKKKRKKKESNKSKSLVCPLSLQYLIPFQDNGRASLLWFDVE